MNLSLTKFIATLAVVSLLASGSALAQNKQSGREYADWKKGPPSVEEKLARISAALELDEEQSREMLVVLQQQQADRVALHEQTMELMGPEICAQKAAHEDAVLAILTTEQAELFIQMKEERKSRGDRKRRGGKGLDDLDCEN